MSLLVANTAGSLEHTRLGALDLVVTGSSSAANEPKKPVRAIEYLPFLATVEASSHGLTRLGAFTGEVTLTTTA